MRKQDYYNEFFDKGQQLIKFNLYQIGLPEDDPVYTLKKILEELNFQRLLSMYKHKGRKPFNPIMMYSLILYANMKGIRSVDKIVDLCERDICFMWLAQGQKPKRDAFYDFKNDKLTLEILEDLHYQFIKILHSKGHLELDKLFIDGTKIEANANRYTFVWRGSINYHLINLLDKIQLLYENYNEFIDITNYKEKYDLKDESIFIIEGSEKVKDIILKNKKRKEMNQKKISNNKILKIDNIGIDQVIRIQSQLKTISKSENIAFTTGKGVKKSELQKLYEAFEDYGERLLKYKKHFEIMGEDRNSYSKTDLDATFMRMKDDHMMNGQLKAGYNVQFAVENYFIIHTLVSNDRTDYNTLIPLLEKHHQSLDISIKEVITDSGYSKEETLQYLKEHHIDSYIKLQEHEIKKTRKYHQNIGKYYNMQEHCVIDENGELKYSYQCHNGKELNLIRIEKRNSKGFERTFEVYGCEDCSGCLLKSECLYKYEESKDQEKNKVMKVNRNWDNLKKESEKNIHTEKGIKYRQIRSVQTEGAFGNMKENNDFRRFNYRTREKVYKEILLYAIGVNLNKYHRFEKGLLIKFQGNVA